MQATLNRIWLLVKRDIIEVYRPTLIGAGAVTGLLLIIYVLTGIFGDPPIVSMGASSGSGHIVVFSLLLFVGGPIITSMAFREVHLAKKNHEWFMLPAATEEKLISRLLLTTVGYTASVLTGYFLATAIAAGVSFVLTGTHLGIFNPFTRTVLLAILNYWVVQSVFLLGAASFRKLHFIKTALSLAVIGIAVSVIAGIVFRIVFAGYFDGMEPTSELMYLFEDFGHQTVWQGRLERFVRGLARTAEVVYWSALAPFCWVVTYFRLREAEVSHGVS